MKQTARNDAAPSTAAEATCVGVGVVWMVAVALWELRV